jgi:hypothetical protein
MGCGLRDCHVRAGSPKAKANKYHANTTFYNGFSYDSIFEANYAMALDWRKKAGEIKEWERQYPVRIEINGEHILTMRADFRILHNDGTYELAETKGFETPDYKIKKRLIEVIMAPRTPRPLLYAGEGALQLPCRTNASGEMKTSVDAPRR